MKTKKLWYRIQNKADDTSEVMIYDTIGAYGVSAKDFCAEFNALKSAKIDLRINCYGGECFDAAAICTAIQEHPAQVTAHVDGVAASAATVIACAADSVQIGKSAFMMIHNPLMMQIGNAKDMRKTADDLDKIGNVIAQVYVDKTGKTMPEVTKAMDEETWFDASAAVAWGLADAIKNQTDDPDEEDEDGDEEEESFDAAAGATALSNFRNVPAPVRRMVALATAGRKEKPPMDPLNVIQRDGKSFVLIDGKEHEVAVPVAKVPAPKDAPPKPLGKSDAEVEAAVNAAKDEAVKAERYRAMFTTVVDSAKLTGEAAQKFEKDFYGRAEADLKFLASHAIGNRAAPVGEGSGEKEPKPADPKDDIRKYCSDRFAADVRLRRSYRVASADANDPAYKAGLDRFVAVETKCRADEAKTAGKDRDPEGDTISKLLKSGAIA